MLAACSAFAAPVPKAIRNRYRELKSALNQVNFAKFKSFFAPEFVSVDPTGKESNLEAFLAGVKPLFDGAKTGKAKEHLFSATKKDGTIGIKFTLDLDLVGDQGTTHVHEEGTDYWKKVSGRWLFVRTVDTKFDVTEPAKG